VQPSSGEAKESGRNPNGGGAPNDAEINLKIKIK
jgi:hypothetical protein